MDISYEDFNLICRLCLVKDPSIHIIRESSEKLLYNLGVYSPENEYTKLPQKICPKCEECISKILTFVNQCKKSYATLQYILEHKKTAQTEVETHDDSSCDSYDGYRQEVGRTLEDTIIETKPSQQVLKTDKIKVEIRNTEIVCKKCNLLLKSRLGLTTHYKESIECRPPDFRLHKCNYCSKELLNLQIKADHENIHTGKTPYKCSYCIKEFKFRTNLHRHINRHELKLGLVEEKEAYKEKTVRLKVKRDKCERVFASRSGFKKHKLKHEGKAANKKNQVKLDKSIKNYLCNYCGMSFYIKSNLDAHLRVHTGERPYKCSQCDLQFKQKSVLKRHTLNHLVVRPKLFLCDVCQKSFTTKSHMEIHKRLHTGERPYECHFCQKSFNYRTRWRIHLRIHTGESPFECNVCNNRYHDKGDLRKHQKKKGHLPKENPENINKN